MTEDVPEPGQLTRVVACQGAVQLASAIASMWKTSGRSSAIASHGGQVSNHLVIHDLSAPEGQGEEFADCLRELAETVESWKSIRFVPLSLVKELQTEIIKGRSYPEKLLFELTGQTECDQLFVGQNNKAVPSWLLNATQSARHICFGDGIALNFTNSYYRPKEYRQTVEPPSFRQFCRAAKQSLKRLIGKVQPEASQTVFDTHCLLLKNLFDQKLDSVEDLSREVFYELFHRFAENFEERATGTHKSLTELTAGNRKIVILLTSNFAETGRMSVEGELRGYRELLSALPRGSNVALVIKPHPRDSYGKIQRIERDLANNYGRVVSLSDPWTFYLPFESLYAKYFTPAIEKGTEVKVATVSSACISLEYLYGQRCSQGFGSKIVAKEFSQLWSGLRQIHESDLERIVAKLRQQVTSRCNKTAA